MFNPNKFKGAVIANGMDMKEIAKDLGIHEATLYRKINDGGNFTRKEIEDLMAVLCIEDPREIFFTKQLA